MTNVNITGDDEGVKLWNLMAESTDPVEKEYFKRLNIAASKFGSIWFSDIVAQRNIGSNQTFFSMKWDANGEQWNIGLFHIPDGAVREIAERDAEVIDDEWDSIDPNDIISVEA